MKLYKIGKEINPTDVQVVDLENQRIMCVEDGQPFSWPPHIHKAMVAAWVSLFQDPIFSAFKMEKKKL